LARTAREWAIPPKVAPREYVSNLIYTDETVFRDEREHIGGKTWKFACHESEIAANGDYRTINHAGYPLIVSRSDDGEIRCFINSCSHRAAQVLREPSGNAQTWTCLFHHWTYDNRGHCIAIPREEGFAESGICKANSGLRELRTAEYLGMVFVNLDDDAPSFKDYVGDALENVEDVMGGPEEFEVFHIYRHVTNTNWKQLQEVQMELYHEYLHFINRQVAMGAEGYHDRKWRIYRNGHATLDPMRQKYENMKGWNPRLEKTLPGLGPGEFRIVDLFPDTCIIARATVMRIDTMVPLSPTQTLLESRGLAIKGEGADDRRMRLKHHNQYWGPFGRNYPEDVLAPEAIMGAIKGGAAPWSLFARHEDGRSQDDVLVRAFYEEWGRRTGRSANDPLRQEVGAE